jgi:signal transduction histidine kinase
MVALSLFSMERFTMFSNYSNDVDHSSRVVISIRSAEVSLRDMGLTERGYMITKDTMYLRYLNNTIDSINKAIATIKELTAYNHEQQKNLALLRGSVALRIAAARDNIAYVDSSQQSTRSKFYDDSRELMIECSRRLRDMRLAENKLLEEKFQSEKIYQKLTNSTLKYLLVIFCLVTLFLFIMMVKELRSRMLYQEELQAKVIDLKRSHNELKEIAYAASHDLQEPLRKIQVFSDMLLYQKNGNEEERQATLGRINTAAKRMQTLITDLMNLTSLTNTDEPKKPVDLNSLIQTILVETHDIIQSKEATVDTQLLPIIDGYETQIAILFRALLDNSLKFRREGVKPVISISCETINGHELGDINPNLQHKKFHRITFSDNGIGFDNKFMDKIFKIFQRLHTQESEYEGKGIGLAICQRVMANHEGYLIAHGEPHMGAHFKLFFPME